MHRNVLWRLVWLGCVLGIAAVPAGAHDPFEITTLARLRDGLMEIDLTMARSTALAIASHQAEAPTFNPADFAHYQPAFIAAAPGLFRVTAGGRTLEMRTAQVSLGRENDVDFHLVYPAAGPGPLHFEAVHLAGLPQGYGNALVVRGDSGVLASALLGAASPTLDVEQPTTRVPAQSAVPLAAPSGRAKTIPVILLGAVALIAGIVWLRRRARSRQPIP
jgi:hypothetical protein